jgi:hypothetical protein
MSLDTTDHTDLTLQNIEMTSDEFVKTVLNGACVDLAGTFETIANGASHTVIHVLPSQADLPKDHPRKQPYTMHIVADAAISAQTDKFEKEPYLKDALSFQNLSVSKHRIAQSITARARQLLKIPQYGLWERVFTATENAILNTFDSTPKNVQEMGIFPAQGENHQTKKAFYMQDLGPSMINTQKTVSDLQDTILNVVNKWADRSEINPFPESHLISFRYFVKRTFDEMLFDSECQTFAAGFKLINRGLPQAMFDTYNFPKFRHLTGLSPVIHLPKNKNKRTADQQSMSGTKKWLHIIVDSRISDRMRDNGNMAPRDYFDMIINTAIHQVAIRSNEAETLNLLREHKSDPIRLQRQMNQLMNGFTPEQLEAMKVQIKEDAFAALIAGSETTAVTISYAFQEVAHNPELQASLINEIDQNKDVLGMKSGDDFNFRHLLNKNEMPVINGLLDRVFEDHSPVPVGFPRIAANDIDHGGVQIKKGDTIVTLYAGTGNPFHRGKHACAGRHLAKLEAVMSVLYAFDRVCMEPISTKSSVPSRKPDSFLGAPRDSAPLLRVRLR